MEWDRLTVYAEPVALAVTVILAVSLIQGMTRGAAGSAKHLLFFIWEALRTVVSLLLAARTVMALSPAVESWLAAADTRTPAGELNVWQQVWDSVLTGFRDSPLMRYAALVRAAYFVYRSLFRLLGVFVLPLAAGLAGLRGNRRGAAAGYAGRAANRFAGALFGAVLGAGRGLVMLAALFMYVSLLPQAPLADVIASSPVYREASSRLLAPVAGRVMTQQGPVFTQADEPDFKQVVKRRHEISDREVPDAAPAPWGGRIDPPGMDETRLRDV